MGRQLSLEFKELEVKPKKIWKRKFKKVYVQRGRV